MKGMRDWAVQREVMGGMRVLIGDRPVLSTVDVQVLTTVDPVAQSMTDMMGQHMKGAKAQTTGDPRVPSMEGIAGNLSRIKDLI